MSALFGNWLSWLAGIDSESVPPGATSHFTFANAPRSWTVFIFAAVIVALVALTISVYRRELNSCPPAIKSLLAALRLLVILLLMLIFLGPAVTFTQTKTIPPGLALLRDASYSMSEKDRYADDRAASAAAEATGHSTEQLRAGEVSRAELVDALFRRDNGALLHALVERGQLRVIDFANHTSAVDLAAAEPDRAEPDIRKETAVGAPLANATPQLPPLQAEGQGTDLVRAVRAGLSTRNVAAVILFTDGQHTVEGAGTAELMNEAERARSAGVPLMVVGVGDPTRIANLTVTDLYASPEVWKNDPFEIQAVVRLQNVTTPSFQVELLQQQLDADGAATGEFQVVDRQQVDVPEGAAQARVSFQHAVREKGDYAYNVRAEPIEGELKTDDNQPTTPVQVRVLSEIRVLLVAGQAGWEYQLLKRLLYREKSVTLTCWLQHIDPDRPQDGNETIDSLPATATELLQYDAVLLLDPDPRGLDANWVKLLRDVVGSEARGLFYLAGNQYSTQLLSGLETRSFADLLPVEFGDLERLELETLDETHSRLWNLSVVPRNADQPIMRFFRSTEATLRKWKTLPGTYWTYPAQSAKPAGRVLIERDEPADRLADGRRPLLVSGMYGAGRIVYMGFDGTWRWRRTPNDAPFYRRFWLQMIRYLVEGRSAASQGRGVVETDRESYTLGDRITIIARRLKNATYDLLDEPEVSAVLRSADGETRTVLLKATAGQQGDYSATITAGHSGLHKLHIELESGSSATKDAINTTFRVALPQLETRQTWLNKPLLTEIAAASGGKYYELNELDALIAAIPDRAQKIRVHGEPIPLWDNSRALLLIVGLLCAEWALRKRSRLM